MNDSTPPLPSKLKLITTAVICILLMMIALKYPCLASFVLATGFFGVGALSLTLFLSEFFSIGEKKETGFNVHRCTRNRKNTKLKEITK